MIAAAAIAKVLGGREVLRRRVTSISDLRDVVEAGLPKRALKNTIVAFTPASADVNQMIFAMIPRATYKRRVNLKRAESEQTERLARIVATALHVLETPDNVRQFLLNRHQLL